MATASDSSHRIENHENTELQSVRCEKDNNSDVIDDNSQYGLPLKEVYRLALGFYKEKAGKAVQFSYEDKLQLVAFSQQVLHGPFADAVSKLPTLGPFDVVGRDRRLAWQKLGDLSTEQARAGFVELLSRKCPLFNAYIEAHRREQYEIKRVMDEEEKKRKEIEETEKLRKEEEEKLIRDQMDKEECIKRQIQQALNEQTYDQFRKYAEQQFPGDPEKQGTLVRQLQEQHYIQYMNQLQAAQRGENIDLKDSDNNEGCSETDEQKSDDLNSSNENDMSPEKVLTQASMWTSTDIKAFKQAVAQAPGDGVIRVGHGETITVRVPTRPDGARLFWEFATDHYDIGFGVYFEFGASETQDVSVHIAESEEEELDDEDYDEDNIPKLDLNGHAITVSKPLISEIIPVFRRDSQNEVYAGSHEAPGDGVYLLKFDNSYSLWRSKTLYYRVFYAQ